MNSSVAIITRTKNRTILLERALQSVLNQNFQDWFLVIINDGGDKNPIDKLVQKYAAKLKQRIKVIHNEKSLGMEAASNLGIRNSKSKYIVIHDDDDTWNKKFLSKTVKFIESSENQNIQGVVTHITSVYERIDGEKVIIESKVPLNTFVKSIDFSKICSQNLYCPIGFIYKREVHDEIGYYRENLPVMGDWDFNIRFLTKFNIKVLTKKLANYHVRNSITSGDFANSWMVGDEIIERYENYLSFLKNEYLRNDIQSGRPEIGMLLNSGTLINKLRTDYLNPSSEKSGINASNTSILIHAYNDIRGNKFLRLFYKAINMLRN